ncbi:hypothetical protein EB796_000252 [Bugula neritina]|uniref:Uncharacterized protein n=1 Tax=Bugula neritina TaxID=10212 RepID=A0A7J7KTD2_BUGNE|nr:hypothetical protein EB796_000252 [Bugula neritina]
MLAISTRVPNVTRLSYYGLYLLVVCQLSGRLSASSIWFQRQNCGSWEYRELANWSKNAKVLVAVVSRD